MQLVETDKSPKLSIEVDKGRLNKFPILQQLTVMFDASIGLLNMVFICTGAVFIYALFRFGDKIQSTEFLLLLTFSFFSMLLMLYFRILAAKIVWEVWSNDRDMHDTY